VAERLPCALCKALNSIPSTEKKSAVIPALERLIQ
jgi:hypothetical protein